MKKLKKTMNMKRALKTGLKGLAISVSVLLISCEGPAGMDANDTCKQCHNTTTMNLKSVQYEASVHASGSTAAYAGGRNSCAACHSHEGFVETVHTGRDTTAANIPIPTRIDCQTCHESHTTFDVNVDGPDFALRTNEAVNLVMFGNERSVNFESSSNLCANCHQPRTIGPTADDEGNFRITSVRYGPHHGPQATYVQGIGAYEFDGPESYPAEGSSSHAKGGACVSCHMGEADNTGGGHTFTANVASCTTCHTDATTLNINNLQTEVHDLLEDIADVLKEKGVLNAEGNVVPNTYPIALAGAYYNYNGIGKDRSLGVHNPAYIKAVLKNTLAAID